MSVDVPNIFERGGDSMITLVGYCIYKQYLDPVFLLLVRDYQLLASASKAIALFEQFLAVQAPLAISLPPVERTNDRQVMEVISKIRQAEQPPELEPEQPAEEESEEGLEPIPEDNENDNEQEVWVPVSYLPSKFVFDGILKNLLSKSTQFADIENHFDPDLSVLENLPQGKLTPAQRHFNEHIWKPSRQQLISAGFFKIANIGG